MKALRLALVAACCAAPLLASAQWMWLDAQGRKVFSDRAPPPDIAPGRILKQPGVRAPAPQEQPAAAAPAPVQAAAAAPQLTGKDSALEQKKKQAEAAEAQKRKAEQEKLAQLQSDNCRRAQASKVQLTSGVRMARVNEKGEREFIDEAQKAQELRFAESVIARDCKGGAPTGLQ